MTTATNDATQTGVPDPDKTQTQEPSARELAMQAIADQRQDSFDTESRGESAPANTDAQLAAQLKEPATPGPVFADDSMLIKTKIDGEEGEATVAEMRAAYQKKGAAERRLEEATRLLNEARAAKPAPDTPVGVAPATQASDSPATPEGDEEGKAFLAALFDGDEEKALAGLKKMGIGRSIAPTLDTSQLAAQLTPAIKQQLVVDSALEKFAVDYADIVADPYLADLADRYLDAEVQGGKPYTEALEEAGKKTRDWLSSKGVVPATPNPTTDRNTKLERKAAMDNIPALNSKATTVDEPVQSATDVINEMRKARGLEV